MWGRRFTSIPAPSRMIINVSQQCHVGAGAIKSFWLRTLGESARQRKLPSMPGPLLVTKLSYSMAFFDLCITHNR